MVPPLVLDIDGTLSRADRSLDERVFPVIRGWDAPVVIATGKALPYPVGLCDFIGIPIRVIAENGGVVAAEGLLEHLGDREGAQAVADEYVEAGYDLGWGKPDFVNRWRETEVAVSLDSPKEPLYEIAERHGLEVVDTGFAYHVKDTEMSKGKALTVAAAHLGLDPEDFVAIGDSENDVSTFEVVGRSFAMANADEKAKAAADSVTDGAYGDGFLEAIDQILA
ncbi:phosphoglycolate phosphatase [Haladaptatus sp. DYSN1]|uniref:phosphoglycolate phosphatase n=1 Tax=unclassified Haladaptatus TaxID=2622732 RepID=UPI002404FB13|nr:phosphoglycolate phosphatase [Haladaptatus sp. DYSN1]